MSGSETKKTMLERMASLEADYAAEKEASQKTMAAMKATEEQLRKQIEELQANKTPATAEMQPFDNPVKEDLPSEEALEASRQAFRARHLPNKSK